jgi:hypothetical protein
MCLEFDCFFKCFVFFSEIIDRQEICQLNSIVNDVKNSQDFPHDMIDQEKNQSLEIW